jgi:hypothetical protein
MVLRCHFDAYNNGGIYPTFAFEKLKLNMEISESGWWKWYKYKENYCVNFEANMYINKYIHIQINPNLKNNKVIKFIFPSLELKLSYIISVYLSLCHSIVELI